ncbi:MAG TPA: hypothetical protein VGA08_00920 [Candidatus Saccharimonadales bacterium]
MARAAKTTTKKTVKKTSSKRFVPKLPEIGLRQWLILSVIANLLLAVGILNLVSNPAKYTDASAGYTVQIPAGWHRSDDRQAFRAVMGPGDNPNAELFAYGQRSSASGFYDLPEADRNNTLDQVTTQINGGQNQFVISTIRLNDTQYMAERGQKADGTEFIRSSFTATNDDGTDILGEHLLLITKSGGVYSIVGLAEAAVWDDVKNQVADAVTNFTAP